MKPQEHAERVSRQEDTGAFAWAPKGGTAGPYGGSTSSSEEVFPH